MSTTATPPSASLVGSCDDPKLLAFKLWPTQRRLLTAVEEHRVNVWCLGRRSGKSTTAALVGLHACTLRPELRRHLPAPEMEAVRGLAV